MTIKYLFILTTCIGSGIAKLAPDFIRPCNETMSDCIKKSSQDAIPYFVKGIPELGVPVLDPFEVEELDIPLKGLTLKFHNGKVHGFRTCIIDNIVSVLENRFFSIDFHCNLTVKGNYESEGKLLIFPIKGGGDATIELFNLKLKIDINTKYTKDKHGANHFSIKDYKYTFDYGDNAKFDLGEPLKGNKEISAKIVEYINENWKTVIEEIGQPIVDYGVKIAMKYSEKFFSKVPYEELINVPLPQ